MAKERQSWQTQLQLAQDMANSLHQLASNLDYIAEQLLMQIELMGESGLAQDEVKLVKNIFNYEFSPLTKKIIIDIENSHIGYLKQQQTALGGAIDETRNVDGTYVRAASDFKFVNKE